MNRLQEKFFTHFYRWLFNHQPEEMQRQVKMMVDRVASDVSIRVSMLALEREGLVHCGRCASRFGLHRVTILDRETYLCDKHYSQWQSQQMAHAAQGRTS